MLLCAHTHQPTDVPTHRRFCPVVFATQAAQNEISIVHLPVARTFDSVTLTHEVATQALEVLVDPKNLPCLLHCYDGTTTTGLVVLCLRKAQSIALAFAESEFSRFQRNEVYEPMTDEERMFVESFRKHDIRTPDVTPRWLWDGASDPSEQSFPQVQRGGRSGGPSNPSSAPDSDESADREPRGPGDTRALHRAANESTALAVSGSDSDPRFFFSFA
jgi:hypothetical protein